MKYIYENKEFDSIIDICNEVVTESNTLMHNYIMYMGEAKGSGFVDVAGLAISIWSIYLHSLNDGDRAFLRSEAVEYYAKLVRDEVEGKSGTVETVIGTIIVENN